MSVESFNIICGLIGIALIVYGERKRKFMFAYSGYLLIGKVINFIFSTIAQR